MGVSGHLNHPVEDECCRIDGQMARSRTVVMDTEFYTKDTGWRLITSTSVTVHVWKI